MLAQDWEALLAKPFVEVRRELNLERPTWYEQAVTRHDPSRSNSRAAQAAVA
jgi:hypothetical protein